MIRKKIRPTNRYINIEIPQEYVGNDLEILIFSSREVENIEKKQSTKKILDEFKKATENIIKIDPNIDIIKLDEDMYNDLF
jgi:hypothetical protein